MGADLRKLLTEYGCQGSQATQETVIPDCVLTFVQIRDSLYLLGNILYEDLDNCIYVATIRVGFHNMSSAVVAMQLKGNKLVAIAYAKEGKVNQGLCEKALYRLADAAHGNSVKPTKPKWIFPSILALMIVVVAVSIGRRSLFVDEHQIEFPSSSPSSTSSPSLKEQVTPAPQEETHSQEELAFIAEINLTIEATKAYNEAVETFNSEVAAYNTAVAQTSVANIAGLPTSLETLSLVSESYEDNAEVVRGENSKEKIAADTVTVMDMSEQVKAMTTIVEQITAPSGEWVANRLNNLTIITGTQAVTEELNPDGLLGKDGGYTSCIYFTVAATLPASVPGKSIVEKGTDAGGAVEVYATLADAEARVEYLAGFDGTVLYSGSYAIVGTMVIRTSYKLSNEQQLDLTSAITAALTSI